MARYTIDRDALIRDVLLALAKAMGYVRHEDLVDKYLAGEDVSYQLADVDKWHFDHVKRTVERHLSDAQPSQDGET